MSALLPGLCGSLAQLADSGGPQRGAEWREPPHRWEEEDFAYVYMFLFTKYVVLNVFVGVRNMSILYIYIYVAAEAPPGAYQRRPFLPSEH